MLSSNPLKKCYKVHPKKVIGGELLHTATKVKKTQFLCNFFVDNFFRMSF
jgi:hypothetical protein